MGQIRRPLRSPPVVPMIEYTCGGCWSTYDGFIPPRLDLDHVPGTHFPFV